MSQIEVKVPDIGDFKDVEIIEVLVKPGDTVRAEQSLITVESDKASMEIPSSAAGVVRALKVKLGDMVNQGSVILTLDSAAAPANPGKRPAATSATPAIPPIIARAADKPAASAAAPAAAASPAPTEAPSSQSQERLEVRVPDIGDFKEVEVIEILVKPGESVHKEQSLITVESDKASMEIPSPGDGVLVEMRTKIGDKVSQGSVIALLEIAAASAPAGSKAAPAPQQAGPGATPTAPTASEDTKPAASAVPSRQDSQTGGARELAHASPSVRKFARELGVDLIQVTASGPKGRILHEDVQAYVKKSLSASGAKSAVATRPGATVLELLAWPSLDFSRFGGTELLPLSRIKKISGPNLARNWAMIPHVTQFDEADITDLESFRRSTNEARAKEGVKVTMLAFVIRACVAALRQFPNFNSSLDAAGENLILKKYFHIGFAADTPSGLVVPVIRDCDRKGILEIASESSLLAGKAREGKLSPSDMQGASFTISSLGGVGGTAFTPIINAPEVAILGLSRSDTKPRWNGHEFVPRLMLPLSLSYDHRVVDGAQAARFTTYLGEVLADMRRVLL